MGCSMVLKDEMLISFEENRIYSFSQSLLLKQCFATSVPQDDVRCAAEKLFRLLLI